MSLKDVCWALCPKGCLRTAYIIDRMIGGRKQCFFAAKSSFSAGPLYRRNCLNFEPTGEDREGLNFFMSASFIHPWWRRLYSVRDCYRNIFSPKRTLSTNRGFSGHVSIKTTEWLKSFRRKFAETNKDFNPISV